MIPLCTQIKPDGILCQSPALRGKSVCYHHARPRTTSRPAVRNPPAPIPAIPDLYLPPLHDAESIVHAICNICQALAHNQMPLPRARLLLKALELARQEMKP